VPVIVQVKILYGPRLEDEILRGPVLAKYTAPAPTTPGPPKSFITYDARLIDEDVRGPYLFKVPLPAPTTPGPPQSSIIYDARLLEEELRRAFLLKVPLPIVVPSVIPLKLILQAVPLVALDQVALSLLKQPPFPVTPPPPPGAQRVQRLSVGVSVDLRGGSM
jgi:hypothetical protein